LPSAGWIDFDPTSGKAGKSELVTVAVVRDPRDAIPLHGTFIGFPSDHIGMEVEVRMKPGTPDAIWATAPGAPGAVARVDWRRPDDDVASEGISGDVE